MNNEIVNTHKVALMEKKVVEDLIVKSKFYPSSIIIEESYCPDPKCNCREFNLKFLKFDEKNKENELLFTIKLNIDTFEVVYKNIYDKSVKVDDIINEFLTDLEVGTKERFNENYKFAKLKHEKILKPINKKMKELISNGNCIAFNEIFDNVETIMFRDDKNNLIYIDDQYCMNPKCHCNKTVLSFIWVDELQRKGENICTLRYSLKNGNYEVELEDFAEEDAKHILKTFKTEEKEIRGKLKRRYDDMKSIGKKINDEDKIKIVPQINDTKVGRNDMCPCGSGKKYKKCCGK